MNNEPATRSPEEAPGHSTSGHPKDPHHGQEQPPARAPGAGNPGNFANNRQKAAEAGRRGGQHSHGGGGAGNNPGNFANNRERAAEAGRKGGAQPRR